MRLGTSTCLFAKHRKEFPEIPYIEQLHMCADAGFKVIDINFCDSVRAGKGDDLAADDWEKRIDALKNEGEKLGCVFSQSHIPFNGNIFVKAALPTAEYMTMFNEMSRRSIVASGTLGVKWETVHALTDTVHGEYDFDETIKSNLEFFGWQVELAKKCGVGISIENMADFHPEKIKRTFSAAVEEQIALIDAFGDPSVGACWDFGHARMIIKDQCNALRKLGKRLKATHVQDNKGNMDAHLIPFVGGDIDWEAIMPCLVEIGYEGDFVYECHSFMNEIPDAMRPEAAKFAYNMGMYCLSLANSHK